MSDMIIRQADAVERFANDIDLYCQSMREVCKKMHSDIDEAEQHIGKEDSSRKAIRKVTSLAEELINSLPEIEWMADGLRSNAKKVRQASQSIEESGI